MKDATLVENATTRALLDLMEVMPLETRLAMLKPEERLVGLSPEERLVGLSPDEQLLALSDEVLRTLPADYIATLAPETQAAIRQRLAR